MIKQLIICTLLILTFQVSAQRKVIIYSVERETRGGNEDHMKMGSLQGGTILIIKASGHDTNDWSNNKIFVGDLPCDTEKLVQGVNENYLTCVTTPYLEGFVYNKPVTIEVKVGEKTIKSQCEKGANCHFNMNNAKTPVIHFFMRKAAAPTEQTILYLYSKFSRTSEIKKIDIGGYQCDRFAQGGLNDDEKSDGKAFIPCSIAEKQEGGAYMAKVESAIGTSFQPDSSYNMSVDGQNKYNFIINPSIKKVSQNVGTEKGQILEIQGLGFSKDKTRVDVTAAGRKCDVLESNYDFIKCQVEEGAQVDGSVFTKGSGFFTQQYSVNKSIRELMTALDNGTLSSDSKWTEKFEKSFVLSELSLYYTNDVLVSVGEEKLSSNRLTYSYGWIKAYETGKYTFKHYVDDDLIMRINLNKNTKGVSSDYTKVFESQCSCNFPSFDYDDSDKSMYFSDPVNLEKDQYYYVEIFWKNGNGPGYFNVAVEGPAFTNGATGTVSNKAQVQKITIKCIYDEQFTIKFHPQGREDIMNLKNIQQDISQDYWEKESSDIQVTTSLDDMCDIISDFFGGVKCEGLSKTMVNENDQPTNNEDNNYGATWLIKLTQMRQGNFLNMPFCNDNLKKSICDIQITKTQGAALEGTWSLQLPNPNYDPSTPDTELEDAYVQFKEQKNPDLPIGYSWYSLDAGLKTFYNNLNIEVLSQTGDNLNGWVYVVRFGGSIQKTGMDKMKIAHQLRGGSSVEATIEILDQEDTVIYEPVPNDMLFQYAESPQIEVRVGGDDEFKALSVSTIDTSYQIEANIDVTKQATGDSPSATVVFDGVNSLPSDLEIIYAIVGNVMYTDIDLDLSANTITINIDETVQAGQKGITILSNKGLLNHSSTTSYTPVLTSVSAEETYNTGSAEVTLTGKHFPTELSGLQVQLDGVDANILSTTNTQMKVELNSISGTGAKNIKVLVDSLESQPQGVTVISNPTSITKLQDINQTDKDSFSPIKKQTIIVLGTFDTANCSEYEAQIIENNAVKYRYIIDSMQTDSCTTSQLKIRLGGGVSGSYQFQIVDLKGPTNKLSFTYEITVTGLSVDSGSYHGMVYLTITGENFSTKNIDNQVLLGDRINQFCTVYQATATELKTVCPKSKLYPDDLQPQGVDSNNEVKVFGRLTERAVCKINGGSGCTFDYIERASSPSLQEDSLYDTNPISTDGYVNLFNGEVQEKNPGDVVSFEDAHDLGSDCGQLYFTFEKEGTIYNDTIEERSVEDDCTDTSVSITIPNAQNGTYLVNILKRDIGSAGFFKVKISIQSDASINQSISYVGFRQQITFQSGIVSMDNLRSYLVGFGFEYPVKLIGFDTTNNILSIQTPTVDEWGQYEIYFEANGEEIMLQKATLEEKVHQDLDLKDETFTAGQDVQISGVTIDSNADNLHLLENSESSFTGSVNGGQVVFTGVPAGVYQYKYFQGDNAVAFNDSTVTVQYEDFTAPSAITDQSIAGGNEITLSSNGNFSENTQAFICGNDANVEYIDSSNIKVTVPVYRTKSNLDTYQYQQNSVILDRPERVGNDSNEPREVESVNLDNDEFYQEDDGSSECFIEFDYGVNNKAVVNEIVFIPTVNAETLDYENAVFQQWNGSTWEQVGETITHTFIGKNRIKLDTPVVAQKLRYYDALNSSLCKLRRIYFKGFMVASNESNTCDLQLKQGGLTKSFSNIVTYSSSTPSISNISQNAGDIFGGDSLEFTGKNLSGSNINVTIDGIACTGATGTSTSITCTTGTKENDKNNKMSLSIVIDGKKAIIKESIKFYYGHLWSRSESWGGELPPGKGEMAVVPEGEVLIIDEDVGKKDSPIRVISVTGGTLVVKDNKNISSHIQIHAEFIIINKGRFIVGQENQRFQSKLTITMYGEYFGVQLPMIGNKAIACMDCQLDIHGIKRDKTWSELAQTITRDDDSNSSNNTNGHDVVTIMDSADWQVGDEIVVASTSYYHEEAEQFRIVQRISDTQFRIDRKPTFRHNGEEYTFGGEKFPMRAEVGLLSRNVVIKGCDQSEAWEYGAHLIIMGDADKGTYGKISYAEFTLTGQPRILGRYAIHYHRVGDASESFVEGVAVHNSFARVTTIHNTHYLRYTKNVGYKAQGHNVFLEDGIETFNQIHDNLIVSARSASHMLQTDLTVACFWITRPMNFLSGNRCAGGDFYGFWYETMDHPEGPSATTEICPIGEKLGLFRNNKAHSMGRFGLRTFKMVAKKRPCDNEMQWDEEMNSEVGKVYDPYETNPTTEMVFEDFESFNNREDGLLAERNGHSTFRNFKVAGMVKAGGQIHRANSTKIGVTFENWLIVGNTPWNTTLENNFHGEEAGVKKMKHLNQKYTPELSAGLIFPRTENFLAKDIRFFNFSENTILVLTCSECFMKKKWHNAANSNSIQGVTIDSSASKAQKVYYQLWMKDIIRDLDGSFTGQSGERWVAKNNNLFTNVPGCTAETDPLWNESVICDKHLTGIRFSSKKNLQAAKLKSLDYTNNQFTLDTLNVNPPTYETPATGFREEDYFQTLEKKIKSKDSYTQNQLGSYLIEGQTINFHWEEGIDFAYVNIHPAFGLEKNDPPFIARFNNSQSRETYEVYKMRQGVPLKNIPIQMVAKDQLVDANYVPQNCNFGDWHYDAEVQEILVCISGKDAKDDKIYWDSISVNSIYCKETCPKNDCPQDEQTEPFDVNWSQLGQWQNGSSARAASEEVFESYLKASEIPDWDNQEHARIPCNWSLNVDVEEVKVNSLIIDGHMIIRNDQNLKISANWIWVRNGKITLENPKQPFTGNLEIELLGQMDTPSLIVDNSLALNKILVNTGTIDLHGIVPDITQTRLISNAEVGSTSITVEQAPQAENKGNQYGWAVGDKIAISPSENTDDTHGVQIEYEIVTITERAENGDNVTFTFQPALQYFHYGSDKPTVGQVQGDYHHTTNSEQTGSLDMRTIVALISRRIKFTSEDLDSWGGTLMTYYVKKFDREFPEASNFKKGITNLSGAEFNNMSKLNSEYGAVSFYNQMVSNEDEKIIKTKEESWQKHKLKSKIENCSFYNNWGSAVSLIKSDGVEFINNSVIDAERFGVYCEQLGDTKIHDNVFMGIKKRITDHKGMLYDPVACIYNYHRFNFGEGSTKEQSIQNNSCIGAQGMGYVFPHANCEDEERYLIRNNTAGSISLAAVLLHTNPYNGLKSCVLGGFLNLFHANRGLMVAPAIEKQLRVTQLIAVELNGGVHLRAGHTGLDQEFIVDTSYFAAFARLHCPDCYAKQDFKTCKKVRGIRMALSTHGNGEHFPLKSTPTQYDVVCVPPSIDTTAFIKNVKFENFSTELVPGCEDIKAFESHPSASGQTGGHYLIDTTCENCNQAGMFKFNNPQKNWRGWFGGCGEMDCTGPENIMVEDKDGVFSGSGETVTFIAKNELIGDKLGCTLIEDNNAYKCEKNDFAVIEFQDISEFRQKAMIAPVYVERIDKKFENILNAWREWEWDGPEPMNKRIMRFISLVEINNIYNVTYTGNYPTHIEHKIQFKEEGAGREDDWILFMYTYPVPLSPQVRVNHPLNGNVVRAQRTDDQSIIVDLTRPEFGCGDNNYFYQNRTIHFKVTGKDCIVYVELKDKVMLTMQIAVTQNEFYSGNQHLSFEQALATMLGITMDRIKIVGFSTSRRRQLTENTLEVELLSEQVIGGTISENENEVEVPAKQNVDHQTNLDNLGALAKKAQDEINVSKRIGLVDIAQVKSVVIAQDPIIFATNNDQVVVGAGNSNEFQNSLIVNLKNNNSTNTETSESSEEDDNRYMFRISLIVLLVIVLLIMVIVYVIMLCQYLSIKKQIKSKNQERLSQQKENLNIQGDDLQQVI